MVHPSFKVDPPCIQATVPVQDVQSATSGKEPSTSSHSAKDAESNAMISSTTGSCKHTMSKSHVHHVVPVKQQEILHDFPFFKGRFGIPCGGKVCHPSPGMNHVSWPMEKSALLPRTLAQLACQDFKKEPPDSLATLVSPQFPLIHNYCCSSTLAVLMEHKFPSG